MAELSRLLADHHQLVIACEQLLETVSTSHPAPQPAFVQLEALADAIDSHLELEHEMIRLAEKVGAATFIPLSVHKGDDFQKLVGDWVDYLRLWPEGEIENDWTRFRTETLPILRRVMTQIEDENRAVRTIMGHGGA